uniref:Uncharacterized protein n=1 Tax=Aegilops tauschii subsp. strangulata TaxID=200361 RepID=A0A453C092_AEGTS
NYRTAGLHPRAGRVRRSIDGSDDTEIPRRARARPLKRARRGQRADSRPILLCQKRWPVCVSHVSFAAASKNKSGLKKPRLPSPILRSPLLPSPPLPATSLSFRRAHLPLSISHLVSLVVLASSLWFLAVERFSFSRCR